MAAGRAYSADYWMAAERISWNCALALMLILVLSCCEPDDEGVSGDVPQWRHQSAAGMKQKDQKPCEELYEVGEGETLQTISARCGDPFILEENPHVQDYDDVFPGLVIRLSPFRAM